MFKIFERKTSDYHMSDAEMAILAKYAELLSATGLRELAQGLCDKMKEMEKENG